MTSEASLGSFLGPQLKTRWILLSVQIYLNIRLYLLSISGFDMKRIVFHREGNGRIIRGG